MIHAVLGSLLLLLVWLRPHPAGWPAPLAVYGPDILLCGVLLMTLAVDLQRQPGLRFRLLWATGLAAMLSYPFLVVVLTGFDPERVSALLVVVFLAVAVTGIDFLADRLPPLRKMLEWRRQRIVLGIVFLIVLSQALSVGALEQVAHVVWGSERLRNLQSSAPRIYGSFYNANWFGIVMALTLVHGIWRVIERRDVLDIGITLGATAALIASGSRSSLLAAALGIGVIGVVSLARLRLGMVLRGLAASVLLGASLVGLFRTSDAFARSSRFTEVAALLYLGSWAGITSLQERLEAWALYGAAVMHHPFLGAGQVGGETTPHNSYLFAMTMFGIPGGLVVLLLLLWLTLRSSGVRSRSGLGRYLSYMVVFLAGGFTAEYWFTTQVFLALCLILIAFRLESESSGRSLVRSGPSASHVSASA